MKKIKAVIKKILGYRLTNYYRFISNTYNKINKFGKKKSLLTCITKCRMYSNYSKLFKRITLKSESRIFYYSIDYYKTFLYDGNVIANLMLDYNKILSNSLNDYCNELDNNDQYSKEIGSLIAAIKMLIMREAKICDNEDIRDSLLGIINRKANSFFDALQRILFINQLMWQTGHYLNGLGRLDVILDEYYINDLKRKLITKRKAHDLLKEFLITLHKDYYFKSNTLSGDTGQIIILGGIDENNNYFTNDLTYEFIDLIKELNAPDPKVLLRVSNNTPKDLIEKSIDCITTGIGCPLFANDDVIIDKLIKYDYEVKDSYNYGTAACWEPFITGKSFDQNNLKSISFIEPFIQMINSSELKKITSYNSLMDNYYKYLDSYLDNFVKDINMVKFGKDLLLSLFTDNCIKNKTDISNGGAKYNNYGFTGVALSNTVNSILSINELVFKRNEYTLQEFNKIRVDNYSHNDKLVKTIKKDLNKKYGTNDKEVINLSNEIIKHTSKVLNKYKNPLSGKYKFGLSAPSYIESSKNFEASFDGRRSGEPFGVHISSDVANGYTDLINFASKLDYGENRFNGNVIDFFVTPHFIKDNFDKFVNFIILSIKAGFFEMQMNVVSSKTLIEARKNPDKFPNLIVRVWGFSAYFKDLPEEYKDYLIERAVKSESNY